MKNMFYMKMFMFIVSACPFYAPYEYANGASCCLHELDCQGNPLTFSSSCCPQYISIPCNGKFCTSGTSYHISHTLAKTKFFLTVKLCYNGLSGTMEICSL